MNKEQLHNFIETSTGNESNICQIYAIKDGKTVYEDNWRGFTMEDAMNVNSVTKGIMGLLAGIAIDQGYIKSVDQKSWTFSRTTKSSAVKRRSTRSQSVIFSR